MDSRRLPSALILAAAILSSCYSTGGVLEDQARTQAQADRRASSWSDSETEPVEPEPPRLSIEGSPSGAQVRVDGIYRGTSPLALELTQGSYRIEISKEGYRDAELREYYDGANSKTISYSLEELTGFLSLTLDPPDASVSGPGLWSSGSGSQELRVGTHVLSVSRFGYAGKTITVSIYEDQTSHESVILERKDLALDISLSNAVFNPREPASLGRAVLRAEPDSYGYARIRVLDASGLELLRRDFPFIEGPGSLEAAWTGRDAGGQPLPYGSYRAVFESWALREPLPGDAFPDWPPDSADEKNLSLVSRIREPSNLLAQVSGAAYCPDATVLDQSWQAGLAAEGSYAGSGLWFGQLRLATRLGIIPRFELGSNLGLGVWAGRSPSILLSLSGKTRLWASGSDGTGFSGALALRGNFFSEGIIIDPWAGPRGAGISLPMELGLGGLDLIFCPELALSPYRVNDPASLTPSLWDHAWYAIPYARAGARMRRDAVGLSLSAYARFLSLDQAFFMPDPPYGAALELDVTDPRTGLRWGLSALCQAAGENAFYMMAGLSLAYIGAL